MRVLSCFSGKVTRLLVEAAKIDKLDDACASMAFLMLTEKKKKRNHFLVCMFRAHKQFRLSGKHVHVIVVIVALFLHVTFMLYVYILHT